MTIATEITALHLITPGFFHETPDNKRQLIIIVTPPVSSLNEVPTQEEK